MKTKFIKFFVTAFFAGSLFSCIEMPLSNAIVENQPTDDWSKLGIPKSFSMDSLFQDISVNIVNAGSNVYDAQNNILGENLPIGNYTFNTAKGASLIVRKPNYLRSANSNNATQNDAWSTYQYGTFVAEDTYPYGGDYDLNDIVFYYIIKNYTTLYTRKNPSGADGALIWTSITIIPKAMGVGSLNVTGLMAILTLPANISTDKYAWDITHKVTAQNYKAYYPYIKVQGNKLYNKYFAGKNQYSWPIYSNNRMFYLNSDGFEFDQFKNDEIESYIPITDDLTSQFKTIKDKYSYERLFINSYSNTAVSDTIKLVISYPQLIIGGLYHGYNPKIKFCLVDNVRNVEIPYTSIRGNYHDATSLPMVNHLPYGFKWPKENVHFWDAYPQFINWAQSNGQSSQSWYNYPNNDLIVK